MDEILDMSMKTLNFEVRFNMMRKTVKRQNDYVGLHVTLMA